MPHKEHNKFYTQKSKTKGFYCEVNSKWQKKLFKKRKNYCKTNKKVQILYPMNCKFITRVYLKMLMLEKLLLFSNFFCFFYFIRVFNNSSNSKNANSIRANKETLISSSFLIQITELNLEK